MGSPSKPRLPEVKDPPKANDPEIEAALERERLLARRKKGRRATILTSMVDGGGSSQGGKSTFGE